MSSDAVIALLDAYALGMRVVFPVVAIATVFERRRQYETETVAPDTRRVARDVLIIFAQCVAVWIVSWTFGLVGVAYTSGSTIAREFIHTWPGLLARGALVLSVGVVSAAITRRWISAVALTLAFTLSVWAFDIVANSDELTAALAAGYSIEKALRAAEVNGVSATFAAVIVATLVSHLALAVAWLRPKVTRENRWAATLAIFIASTVLTGGAGWAPRVFLVALPVLAIGGAFWWRRTLPASSSSPASRAP